MPTAIEELCHRLAKCKRVLVTTHVKPDGDALGSTSSVVWGLRQKGVAADLLLLSKCPAKYAFVPKEIGLEWIEGVDGPPTGFTLGGYDAVMSVDTGTASQLPGIMELLKTFGGFKAVLDHHKTQEDWAELKVVDSSAAAACEMALDVLDGLGVRLTPAVAQALFVGLTTDTGWFQFSNTSPETLRRAARLLEAGANLDQVYQRLYQSERAARVSLHARAVDSMQLLAGGRASLMSLTKQDFTHCGATTNDTEAAVNIPMQIASVQLSALLTEPPSEEAGSNGLIRVSLRSKGQVDCSVVAQKLGGGGHARAAGFRLPGPLSEAVARVRGVLEVNVSA